ncbi:MAG: metallophosphoesterase family protein [Planctomycetes bacterium]|jgi:predicted phosphodiesterase|nr:metallophosphoesterase family protein [Planctomycetota bacterium]HNZ65827.1 metallophosphoesterase family protein [Planctomycetota bacterium]HPY74362.1 metallophosphoesterase family protein [Planctomycetota bacterium]HQA99872.1 metallophosphoesterase family protein [Planctomycetota bacterium]
MRFGIIADVHANLEALMIAFHTLKEENVDQIISLGDVVGYNANPAECLNLIMEHNIPSIKGNHERYVIGEKQEHVKEDTMKMLEWTRNQLEPEHYEFISQKMPNKMLHEEGFIITHGSLRNKDEYLIPLDSFVKNLKLMEEKYPEIPVCFHAHSHLPSVMARGHMVQSIHEDIFIKLHRDKQYLINPGSVGQPRDKCPLCSFGIFNSEEFTFQFFRRPYDIPKTQEKINRLGFAPRFASRLSDGK